MNKFFKPFPEIIVPVFEEFSPEPAITIAKMMAGKTLLLGFIEVPVDKPLSRGSSAARQLRMRMNELKHSHHLEGNIHVSVSNNLLHDFLNTINAHKPNLVILPWPQFIETTKISYAQIAKGLTCDLALIAGPLLPSFSRSLVPLRGGPNAQLALRLALAFPTHEITALHITSPTSSPTVDSEPFKGLARILPSLSEVNYRKEQSENPLKTIVEHCELMEALILGAPAINENSPNSLGLIAETLIEQFQQTVIVVKSRQKTPEKFSGVDGELSGTRAISVLVDRWFASNTYHASEFEDFRLLVEKKKERNVTISLALPALNEEETVGKVIKTIKSHLMDKFPLLDEIVLIDSNSIDRTREIVENLGVPVYIHQDTLPQYGARAGKGEALWKSLYVTKGDILVWIDSDIVNIHPRFVSGVIGPLLTDDRIQFVKGFYQRPLRTGRRVQSTGGGRVTELTARPLINLFYPELSGIIQPLSGEYGGRRKALESLTFFSGYGVETGLLIDVFEKYGLSAIAQVDLLERIHHNQSLQALSKMSFLIIQTVLKKLEKRYNLPLLEEVNKTMKIIQYQEGSYYLDVQEIPERERPPMISLKEYKNKVMDIQNRN